MAGNAIEVNGGNKAEVSIDHRAGKRIVVVHHPDCHFTQNAFRQISSRFRWALEKDGLFLASFGLEEDFGKIARWNAENPKFKTYLVKDEASWSGLDLSSVPNFYFLREGKIACHVKGWPKKGRHREIARCLQIW